MKKPNYISPGQFSTSFSDGVLRSKEFNDIYFSADNGVNESNHVYIEGNNLKQRLLNSQHFTISELGFGSGLNFLLTWKLFNKANAGKGYLDYISIEGFPLNKNLIRKVHSKFPELSKYSNQLLNSLPPLWSGIHRIHLNDDKIRLTLVYEEVFEALQKSTFQSDAWFLDGFNPKTNKEMWDAKVLSEVFRLTKPSGTFSTFSSAGQVRRDLEKVGFKVKKIDGFGYKKEMTIGKKCGEKKSNITQMNCLVIGGGIAGVSIAYSLKNRVINPCIIEKENGLAYGASGNLAAIQYPRLTSVNTPAGRLSLSCYRYSRNLARQFGVALEDKSIILGLPAREKIKQNKLLSQGWPEDLIRKLREEDELEMTNSKIGIDGIVHDFGGTIKPVEFVHKLISDNVERILGNEIIEIIRSINGWSVKLSNNNIIHADTLILACSEGLRKLKQTSVFNLQYTQGQITYLENKILKNIPKTNFSFSGYVTPPVENKITIGATFEKNAIKRDFISKEANQTNLKNIPDAISKRLFGLNKIDLNNLDGRVSMRVSTFDRMPMMGQIEENLYILSALGARGMIMAPLLGDALASIILGQPCGLDQEVVKACDPNRVERSFLA